MQNIPTNTNLDKTYVSSLLVVHLTEKSRLGYFTTHSQLSIEQGNLISYEFNKKNQFLKAIYDNGKIWIIRHPNDSCKRQEWQEQLNQIGTENYTRMGNLNLRIKQLEKVTQPSNNIIAKLITCILKRQTYQESWQKIVDSKELITIYRYLDISSETFANQSSISLNWKTSAKYLKTLKDFWLKQQEILLGIEVVNRFIPNKRGVIDSIVGFCNDQEKTRLLSYPDLHPMTRQVIERSTKNDLIVSVKSSRWGQETYAHYLLEGLQPSFNEKNCNLLGINYELYQNKTKINLKQWQELLIESHKKISETLKSWDIIAERKYVNSTNYPEQFYLSEFNQENVKLRFGNSVIVSRKHIKLGLTKGGVYRRNEKLSNPLQLIILNLSQSKPDQFLEKLKLQLESIGFEIEFIQELFLKVENSMSEKDTILIEETIRKIAVFEPDLVITILPKGDKKLDETERGSYYYHISHQLFPQGIASQMIAEENINNQYILNNVVLGILAKLGNLPFVLAEPIKVADYFIGLDVAHERKSKTGGTKNACACVRIYGSTGEFIKYKLADSLIEGEEIPPTVLRKLLPFEDLSQKTVLIFRDGRFRGKEISFLKERAEAIGAKFIFVEITKTGTCRLFNQIKNGNEIKLQQPTQYLVFKHSEKEATITTTQPLTGIVQPIRVTIIENEILPPLDDVIEATIKLCLLHHGSYREAGIPMPIFASDKIGYKALKGLYHVQGEGEKQWWH